MKKFLVYLVSLVVLVSCVDQAEQDNTPSGNFEALWQIMDWRVIEKRYDG